MYSSVYNSSPLRAKPFLGVTLWLVLLLFAARSFSADAMGSVSGSVTDPRGAAISNASINLARLKGGVLCSTRTDPNGHFDCSLVPAGQYEIAAKSPLFITLKTRVSILSGQTVTLNLQFREFLPQKQVVIVKATAPSVLNPDPSQRVVVHSQALDANPGRPGAPISIPGLPIETASGGIKAPQYFAPGVAGDHGEPIAQYFQVGNYLYPNNLPANAHGNGYADPNFLIAPTIAGVKVDSGAFNVRQGNNSVDLAASYEPEQRLNPFAELTADDRDVDLVTGWSPTNPDTHAWVALEGSFGNGFLKRLEHRKQYKVNAFREFKKGGHDVTLFGIGYYGFSYIPGLIPTDVPVPNDTVDYRQLDRTHTSIAVASDDWKLSDAGQLLISGFFRTYSLTLRSNFGDGLIQQSEFRTVAGGEAGYLYRIRHGMTLLAGIDLRRDAPRGLDLKHLDPQDAFLPVTSNDLTLGFVEPFVSLDGGLGAHFRYNVGLRREEVNFDNLDLIHPQNSFDRLASLTLPKATFTALAPDSLPLPSVSLSYGEAFHTDDPRIGTGTVQGTLLPPSRAYQVMLRKGFDNTDLRIKLIRVSNAQELAKIDPDTGLQEELGPSLIHALTISLQHYFSYGSFYVSFARANAKDLLTGGDVPEAPRLIWDAVGTVNRLPLHLQARGEFEYVGRKPLGDGFTAVPVREIRGALSRPFADGRMDVGINFLLGSGFTGQTLETLALPTDPAPFERIVGVPLKNYITLSWRYNFGKRGR